MTALSRTVLGLLAAASLLGACAEPGAKRDAPRSSAASLGREAALSAVATYENERWDGEGRLEDLSTHRAAEVRQHACVALGRMPLIAYGAPVTAALCTALNDPEVEVRRSALFALGMRADPEAALPLLAALESLDAGDDITRALLIEAAGKIATPELRQTALDALDDPSPVVRIEAAVGPHRWTVGEDPGEDARVDAALSRVAAEEPRAHTGAAEGLDQDVVWRALFSLQRRGSEAGREVFLERSRTEGHPLVRLFAVKGLAQLESDDQLRAALEHALLDEDWRVVFEALVGLERAADPRSVDVIERILAHPSSQVRAAAFIALGSQSQSDRILGLLERARVHRSSSVRASALEAEARLRGAALAPDLELKMTSKDPVIRAACARAAGRLPSELGVPYLAELIRDRSLRVSTTAIEALAQHPTPASRELLTDLLQGRDNGRRLAAVMALRSTARPEDVADLRRAFERSRGDIAAEVKFNCLLSAEQIGTPEALGFVRDALDDPHPYVRQVAFEILDRAGQRPISALDVAWPESEIPEPPVTDSGGNPIVEISTNRGLMTFELFASETPVHVHNFLELAQADYYDGLNFHRVAPDFVIQGGCYRGDGNGASPWLGEALRHEIGPRKYIRGSLGMPRNQDMESGGSQFFVTHRPTPHLDGRYTIFGQLRSGSLVLDSIEVGDVILDVRLLD